MYQGQEGIVVFTHFLFLLIMSRAKKILNNVFLIGHINMNIKLQLRSLSSQNLELWPSFHNIKARTHGSNIGRHQRATACWVEQKKKTYSVYHYYLSAVLIIAHCLQNSNELSE